MLGILRGVDRARADVAEAASHAHPVGADEIGVVIIARIAVIAPGVPARLGFLVEGGIGEQAQSDNAAGFAIIRAEGNRLAARADFHARIFPLVGERIGRAGRVANVAPKAILVRPRGRRETGLVDEAELGPAIVAPVGSVGVRRNELEQVESAKGRAAHRIPEAVVAAGPDQPHVAALDFRRGQGNPIVHVLEIILVGVPEVLLGQSRECRFVLGAPWMAARHVQ